MLVGMKTFCFVNRFMSSLSIPPLPSDDFRDKDVAGVGWREEKSKVGWGGYLIPEYDTMKHSSRQSCLDVDGEPFHDAQLMVEVCFCFGCIFLFKKFSC